MPRSTRPETSDYFQRIFQTQPSNPWPRELRHDVQPVFPYMHGSALFDRTITPTAADIGWFSEEILGALDDDTVFGAAVPAGFYDVWLAGDAYHDHAAAQAISLNLYSAFPVTLDVADKGQYSPIQLSRAVVIPPGWSPLSMSNVGAAERIVVHTIRLRLIPGMDSALI